VIDWNAIGVLGGLGIVLGALAAMFAGLRRREVIVLTSEEGNGAQLAREFPGLRSWQKVRGGYSAETVDGGRIVVRGPSEDDKPYAATFEIKAPDGGSFDFKARGLSFIGALANVEQMAGALAFRWRSRFAEAALTRRAIQRDRRSEGVY
jgi:hypothetical protein